MSYPYKATPTQQGKNGNPPQNPPLNQPSTPYPPRPGYPADQPSFPPSPGYPMPTPDYNASPTFLPIQPEYPSSTPPQPINPRYSETTPYPPNPRQSQSSSYPTYEPTNPRHSESASYPPATPRYSASAAYRLSPRGYSVTGPSQPSNPVSTNLPIDQAHPPPSPGNPGYTDHFPSYTPGYSTSITAHSNLNQLSPANKRSSATPRSNPQRQHPFQGSFSGDQVSATVKEVQSFEPKQDAAALRKAMKGLGTDESSIIRVLTKRTNAQRQIIAKSFKTLYGRVRIFSQRRWSYDILLVDNPYWENVVKDLIHDLKSETSGNFKQLLIALMTSIDEFYAAEVHHAISGIGTTESTLIEVLCTLSNAEINYVKAAYERMFKKSMESDLANDTSGNFKRLLISLCVGGRDENTVVDQAKAEADAHALHHAGELRFGTDESTFNAILCSRSYPQLRMIFHAYERISSNTFEKAIKKEFSGDIKDGLIAITKCVMDKPGFLAECLHDSMAGLGTNDRALIRLMVTRCEVDLEDIKQQFQTKYGKSLHSYIKGDTSGKYRDCLIGLLG